MLVFTGLGGLVVVAGVCWACLDMLGLLDFLVVIWLAGLVGGQWVVLNLL